MAARLIRKLTLIFLVLAVDSAEKRHIETRFARDEVAGTLGAIFLAGVSYLGVREILSANVGGAADWRLTEHLEIEILRSGRRDLPAIIF